MTEKLWHGRFSEKTAQVVETFTSSIQVDRRLYAYDIQGSIAHCKMLAKVSIITGEEAGALIQGLEKIKQDSLTKVTREYVRLRKEVAALQVQIKEQKDQIIQTQDIAIDGYRQIAESSFNLTLRSMENTDRAVETISRAQRQTWLFSIGGVLVGASIGLVAGLIIK